MRLLLFMALFIGVKAEKSPFQLLVEKPLTSEQKIFKEALEFLREGKGDECLTHLKKASQGKYKYWNKELNFFCHLKKKDVDWDKVKVQLNNIISDPLFKKSVRIKESFYQEILNKMELNKSGYNATFPELKKVLNVATDITFKRELLARYLLLIEPKVKGDEWYEVKKIIKNIGFGVGFQGEAFVTNQILAHEKKSKKSSEDYSFESLKKNYKRKNYRIFLKSAVYFLNHYENSKRVNWIAIKIRQILTKKSESRRASRRVTHKDRSYLNLLLKLDSKKTVEKVLFELFHYPLYPQVQYLVENFKSKTRRQSFKVSLYYGLSLFFLGKLDKAKDYFESVKLGKESVDESYDHIKFMVGYILYGQGQTEQALLKWQEYLQLPIEKQNFRLQSLYFSYLIFDEKKNDRKKKELMSLLEKEYPLTYYTLKLKVLSGQGKSIFSKQPLKFKKPLPEILKEFVYWHKVGWERPRQIVFSEGQRDLKSKYTYYYFEALQLTESWFELSKSFYDLNDSVIHSYDENYLTFIYPQLYFDSVEKNSKKFKVNTNLILGLIKQESSFNAKAVSPAGARGLMQLMSPTAREVARQLRLRRFRLSDLDKPKVNIKLGTSYITRMTKAFGDDRAKGLAAYNLGIGKLRIWLKHLESSKVYKPENKSLYWVDGLPWGETRFYVKAVLRNELIYRLLRGEDLKEIELSLL